MRSAKQIYKPPTRFTKPVSGLVLHGTQTYRLLLRARCGLHICAHLSVHCWPFALRLYTYSVGMGQVHVDSTCAVCCVLCVMRCVFCVVCIYGSGSWQVRDGGTRHVVVCFVYFWVLCVVFLCVVVCRFCVYLLCVLCVSAPMYMYFVCLLNMSLWCWCTVGRLGNTYSVSIKIPWKILE